MLQKTYSIYADDLNDVQLFIEAGKNHIACWCKKQNEHKLKAFEFFQCDDYAAENFEDLIDNTRLYSRLLTMPVNNTRFFWNTDETLCLPLQKSDDFLKENFELILGDSLNKKIFSSTTNKCTVAWRIENRQQQIAQESFRGAIFDHQYTSLFSSPQFIDKTGMHLLFYPHYFTLIVIKDEKLQFAQTRKYNSPEDVLYFVLNVFEQYNIEKNTTVFCGGFINEQSKLYEALFQYIEGFQLMNADENLFDTAEFKNYSPHYFAPYINYVV
jgi:hypothetical protein